MSEAIERFAVNLVDDTIQSALSHCLSEPPSNQFITPKQLAEDFPTLTLKMETVTIAPVILKSCVHKDHYKDGRKRSVTFDPKFVKDNSEEAQKEDPRQRRVSVIPTVTTQPEEYFGGDEEVTRL